ncbi:hypothetical protein [Pseudoxanthomonas wuyuanensis]|uniref:Uncharacterized protein n=1 Tax=Pseudoxanthomonas wuyuanensis TaxID=1073196 RepID=A0A286DG14_9GAMM|nr:hypothetical protein [Pseudoxanthomonas wuyuanensis]KAF1719712.1 hypothetical protein CSC75_14545 [Pseudoxanthomonas wuyuanensis]SOD57692.1 hypothetical protein SAMN06296416_11545 [Pseudoxanthomonas wuyuanensis]
MYYWNKDNFEGLASLAAGLAARKDFAHLAEYCRLREAGLRREAFAALNTFLACADTWESKKSQDAVNAVLTLYYRTPGCHQFLTQPLLNRFVYPALQRWSEDNPESIAPVRWLAILRRDPELLGRVLVADPTDVAIRRMVIERHLSSVDYATHHLNEGLFIGELDEALEDLARATDLIGGAADRELLSDLDREAQQYGQMLFDWQAYKARPIGSFPEWCAARGRDYHWSIAVYYGEGAT